MYFSALSFSYSKQLTFLKTKTYNFDRFKQILVFIKFLGLNGNFNSVNHKVLGLLFLFFILLELLKCFLPISTSFKKNKKTYDLTLLKPEWANSFGNFFDILGFILPNVAVISSS